MLLFEPRHGHREVAAATEPGLLVSAGSEALVTAAARLVTPRKAGLVTPLRNFAMGLVIVLPRRHRQAED